MEGGVWRVEGGGWWWRVEGGGGGWRVEGGGWRVEGAGWRVECGGWRVEGGAFVLGGTRKGENRELAFREQRSTHGEMHIVSPRAIGGFH